MIGNDLVRARADAAVLSRDYDLAVRLYSSLLEKSPNDIFILEKIGSIYVKSGNDKKALPFYNKINELKPNDFNILNDLGGIYRRLKLYDDSIKVLEEAKKLNVDDAKVNYNLGFTYKFMGEYDDAVACFENVIQNNPNDVLAYNHLGSIFHSRGQIQKAIQTYQKGLKVDCNHPVLHLNLAKSYEAENEINNAISEYELALRSKPGWHEVIYEYSKLLIRINRTKEAKELISHALSIDSKDSKMYSTYGSIFLKESDYESAINEYKKSLSINPLEKKSLVGIAEALEENGESVDAIEYIEKVEQEYPDDLSILKKSAEISLSANRTIVASNKIKKLLDINSEDIESLDLAGQFFIIKDEDLKADNCYKKIEQINPAYVQYLAKASKRYKQKGNLEEAEKYIKQYISKSPNDSKAFVNLALIAESLGKTNEALNHFRKALQINNNNYVAKKSLLRISDYLTDSLDDNSYVFDEQKEDTKIEQVEEQGEESQIKIDEEVESDNTQDLILTDEEISPIENDLWKSESWDPDSIVEEVEDPFALLDGDDESISTESNSGIKQEEPSIDNIEEELEKEEKEMPSVVPLENLVDSISEPSDKGAVLGNDNAPSLYDDEIPEEDLFGDSDLSKDYNPNSSLPKLDEKENENKYDRGTENPIEADQLSNKYDDKLKNNDVLDDFDMPKNEFSQNPNEQNYSNQNSQLDNFDEPYKSSNLEFSETKEEPQVVPDDFNKKAFNELKNTLDEMKNQFARELRSQQNNFRQQPQPVYNQSGISNEEASRLMDSIAKTQDEANKAMAAAEKAWMAAGQAADAAQVAQVAESALTDMASDVVMQASEKIRMEAEDIAKKATEKALADRMAIIDNVLPKFEEMLQKADELPAEKSKEIQQAILLFKSLRELGENLPDDAKDEFLKSTNRMKIDYIINRLSGNLGLLKVAQKMRDDGAVVNYVKDSEVPIDYNGKKLAKNVLSAMMNFSEQLQDKNLVQGLNKVVSQVLSKL